MASFSPASPAPVNGRKAFYQLTDSQREFVGAVCADVAAWGKGPLVPASIYGDGSESPNGERFAAVREGSQFRVLFDFNLGWTYETAVMLPV